MQSQNRAFVLIVLAIFGVLTLGCVSAAGVAGAIGPQPSPVPVSTERPVFFLGRQFITVSGKTVLYPATYEWPDPLNDSGQERVEIGEELVIQAVFGDGGEVQLRLFRGEKFVKVHRVYGGGTWWVNTKYLAPADAD